MWDKGSPASTVKAVFNKNTPSFTHGSRLLFVGEGQSRSRLNSQKIFCKVAGI